MAIGRQGRMESNPIQKGNAQEEIKAGMMLAIMPAIEEVDEPKDENLVEKPWICEALSECHEGKIRISWFEGSLNKPYHRIRNYHENIDVETVYLWDFQLNRNNTLPKQTKKRIERTMVPHQRACKSFAP
jgi:hypothetical protein